MSFADSDLVGWNPDHTAETMFESRNTESSSVNLRGTPPSAGMGLSHVFTRDQETSSDQTIISFENTLEQFNSVPLRKP